MAQYNIITTPVIGGNTSKTVLALMQTAYLAQLGRRLLVVDFARCENLYAMLAYLFGLNPSQLNGGSPPGYKFFESPCRKLGVVRPQIDEDIPSIWGNLTRALNIICQVHRRFTDVIVETNISPLEKGLGNLEILENADQIWRWAVMDRHAVCVKGTYQVFSADIPEGWLCVHNSLFGGRGRTQYGDMPAMQSCHTLITRQANPLSADINDLLNCLDITSALNMSATGTDNDFWNTLYGQILNSAGCSRWLPLLPVYRFVKKMNALTASQFRNVNPVLQSAHELGDFLDMNLDQLYSDVYKPFFETVF